MSETKIREADRDDVTAWLVWLDDAPDEGSLLIMLDPSATSIDAGSAALEVLEISLDSTESVGHVTVARKAWSFVGGKIVTFGLAEVNREEREPTNVELDLLEELTSLRRLVPEN